MTENLRTDRLLEQARDYLRAGHLVRTRELCQSVLDVEPYHQDARFLLAHVARAQANPYEALEILNGLMAEDAIEAAWLVARARIYRDLKSLERALADYDAALALAPGYFQARNGKALLLQSAGKLEDALAELLEGLSLDPTSEVLHFNCANLLASLGRHAEAAQRFREAVTLKPDWVEAHFNLGNSLRQMRDFAQAVDSYERAIDLNPKYGQAHLNCGAALVALNEFDRAIECYGSARRCALDIGLVEYNLGNACKAAKRFDEAIAHYDKVPASSAHYNEAQWNKGLTLLLLGHYEAGWPLYEMRWQLKSAQKTRSRLSSVRWTGKESLHGKWVFVCCEQGHGDVFQFCRYASLLANAGARVVLQCHPSQVGVLGTVEGVELVCAVNEPVPEHDLHCDLASLPGLFNTTLASIPGVAGGTASYLRADAAKVQYWADRLGKKTKPRIGIVWSSTSAFKDDHLRSVTFSQFSDALDLGAFDYICLQKEIKQSDHAALAARTDIRLFCDDIEDYSDTAALIENCDLVVSTCTSVPHLSGALGKPTWILLSHVPDFRWLLDRQDSPWYPTARLFRQPDPGDWAAVMQSVRHALLDLSATKP